MKNKNVRDLVLCSLFVALIAIGAFIKIPIPVVPFTLQLLFTMLAGLLLGPSLGFLSVLVYIILGLIGLPIFTEGGGIFYIFKPSFGFLLSFATFPLIQATLSKLFWRRKWLPLKKILIINYSGLLYLYLIGLLYKCLILFFYLKETNVLYSVLAVSTLIDLSCDILLVFVASLLTYKLLPLIHKHKLANQLFIS